MILDNKKRIRGLISVFKIVVSALESQSITHGWHRASSTNMGLISQAVTGRDDSGLHFHFTDDGNNQYYKHFRYHHSRGNKYSSWWIVWIKTLWPLSGQPQPKSVLEALNNAGFERDDIVDFEYLNSPDINDRFDKLELGHKMEPVYETQTKSVRVPVMKKQRKVEQHYRTDWWGKLWGFQKTVVTEWEEEVDFYLEDQEVQIQVDEKKVPAKKNYKNRGHVIAYYKETVKFLEEKLEEIEKEKPPRGGMMAG